MKRIGYLVFCLYVAARAAVRPRRQSLRLAATAAQKPTWLRMLVYRSVALVLNLMLLGTAAILLAWRFAMGKTINSRTLPLLGSGAAQDSDCAGFLQPESPLQTPEPALALPEEAATAAFSPLGAADSVLSDSPGAPSRFRALREVLFADGLPDLRGMGRRGELSDPDQPAILDSQAMEPDSGKEPRHEAAIPPVLSTAPLPVSPELSGTSHTQTQPHFTTSRLDRGEPVDEIQILPSQPGQYRRKAE